MEEQLNSLAVTHLLQHTLRSLCIHDNSQWVYAVFWRILPRNYPPPKLIGKVAADHSHKWIHKEPNDQEINFLSAWHNSADSQPRTWEAQFQSGIKTIALIAVREGVIQLGAVHKVIEDLSYVVLLRKKFSYIESIPGVLLPHPSSSAYPFKIDHQHPQEQWHNYQNINLHPQNEYYDHFAHQPMKVTPSMSSLEALLSKLPSVVPSSSSPHFEAQNDQYLRPMELMAKEEYEEDEDGNGNENVAAGETSGVEVVPPYHHHGHGQPFAYHHHDLNVSSGMDNNNGC
ncbi:transcription factor bhlh155 [Phtheirospermum japonicum]|uniref:Transcription factor bhlh155 n=1 Tax=Phtheirospermum japonicum TaxID=374723 RepID=A0A830C6B0_9LAMI|nr:transcription factor bhlh155 [Phtheirospermum japonicum]